MISIASLSRFAICFLALALGTTIEAEPPSSQEAPRRIAQVRVRLGTERRVGSESRFDRKKFITLHSCASEPDWRGESEKLRYLLNDLDTYFGRDTGQISWELTQLREDPQHRGYVDFPFMQYRGQQARKNYASRTDEHAYRSRSDLVIAAQVHPFWPDGEQLKPADGSEPWALSTPEATAQYMVYWYNMYTGGEGMPRPRYLEIMNEPIYELVEIEKKASPQQVFEYHRTLSREIRKLNQDVQLGGYTTAFPDFELDDFERWNERWRKFIDLAGDEMDFYSLHLYDFPGIDAGQKRYRKGANLEATLDMLEHYSHIRSGETKPLIISEYGAQLNDWYSQPWSPYRDWLCLKSMNSMLMQFLQRPDVIEKAIPFVTAKAEWGFNYGGSEQPYYWRLLRRQQEPESYSGDWVFTDLIKFYELWSPVRGTRVDTTSSDINLLVDCYVDGNKAFVLVNNLTAERAEFDLDLVAVDDRQPNQVYARHLYLHDNRPRLDIYEIKDTQETIILGAESTMILEMSFAEPIEIEQTVTEQKLFASSYLQPIRGGRVARFMVDGLVAADNGRCTLRLGIGRDHGSSLSPKVTVNGQPIPAPESIRGPNQHDRSRFFGVLEIPVPLDLIQESNEVAVEFPDDGGHISSVALQAVLPERE
ncbi:MAG: hypothetical protein ACR2NZ_21885 [Rubripirellula sp.]